VVFRYLREGKLFEFDVRAFERSSFGMAAWKHYEKSLREIECFWLCASCALTLTLVREPRTGKVLVVPHQNGVERGRDVDDTATANLTDKAGPISNSTSARVVLRKTTRGSVLRLPVREFEVHPWLGNPHLMTMVAEYWPRNLTALPQATERLFDVGAGTRLLAKCHWQAMPLRHPTLVLVHGLEGSSESRYMLGIADKAFAAGLNVLRVNQRNCGRTEHWTPTLSEAGLSRDYRVVLEELIEKDHLPEIFYAGYSMGGNLVVKMTGELGAYPPRELRAVCAVCPSLDLAASSDASDERTNILYKWYFLWSFKKRIRRKAKLFPDCYHVAGLWRLRTMREWHETITAPACGYHDAADYYYRASALRVIDQIRVPTLILAAQDDPIIPIASFRHTRIMRNPFITLVMPEHGGHCGFVSRNKGDERFWAEPRVVEFCTQHSEISKAQQSKIDNCDLFPHRHKSPPLADKKAGPETQEKTPGQPPPQNLPPTIPPFPRFSTSGVRGH
jgi:predicted alpha/beta-fold hydrolase